jgi:hypothetical protein
LCPNVTHGKRPNVGWRISRGPDAPLLTDDRAANLDPVSNQVLPEQRI